MKLFKRIALCALATALLLPSIHAETEPARWHTKTHPTSRRLTPLASYCAPHRATKDRSKGWQSLKKTTKQTFHNVKAKLSSLKSRMGRRWTQRQLLIALILYCYIAYCAGIFIIFLESYITMPYTEEIFLRALHNKDQKTINDYLDNKRVTPSGFINGERALIYAIQYRTFNGVKKLVEMGADPRMRDSRNRKAICTVRNKYKSTIDKIIQIANDAGLPLFPGNQSHLDALHRKIENFEENIVPVLERRARELNRPSITQTVKQVALWANRNGHPLPPDMWQEILKHIADEMVEEQLF